MKAVVFDMDGVIVDSELQWKLSEGAFFRGLMPHWRDEDHHKIVGLGVVDLYHWLVKEYSLAAGKESFLSQCHDLALTIYRDKVTCTPGFRDLCDALKGRGLKVGLASSSPRAWIDLVLERFALGPSLDAVVSADDVGPGKTKPEPDIYLLAARRLALAPADCLAVEDSRLGVKAAKRAGMACAALRNGANEEQDLSEADFELRGFSGVTYESLISRLSAA